MARVHAEGQPGHSVPFWLHNLPSNLFMLNERQMLTIVFLVPDDFFSFPVVQGHRGWPRKQQESFPLLPL